MPNREICIICRAMKMMIEHLTSKTFIRFELWHVGHWYVDLVFIRHSLFLHQTQRRREAYEFCTALINTLLSVCKSSCVIRRQFGEPRYSCVMHNRRGLCGCCLLSLSSNGVFYFCPFMFMRHSWIAVALRVSVSIKQPFITKSAVLLHFCIFWQFFVTITTGYAHYLMRFLIHLN